MSPDNPVSFKRGSTFSFAVNIPVDIETGFFKDWEVNAQVRRERDDTNNGIISTLGAKWDNPNTARRLVVFDATTDKWPLGLAELDIVFTSPTGYRVRSKTIKLKIERGITR